MIDRLERLWNLPQPEFSKGERTPVSIAMRRAVRGRLHAPAIVNRLTEPFLSSEVLDLKTKLQVAEASVDPWEQPARQLLKDNLYFLPSGPFLRAGPFHCDMWLRDSFIGTRSLGYPEVEDNLLAQFEGANNLGSLPTTRLFPGTRAFYFDDESTMLGLIWRAKLEEQGVEMNQQLKELWRRRWNNCIDNKVAYMDDMPLYWSSAGTEKSWFDTFKFKTGFSPDVISYNQGIFAVATLAADRLGINSPKISKQAAHGYHWLSLEKGYLPLSYKTGYKDASSLFGEFLALTLFGKELLPNQVVLDTYDALPKLDLGIPVVAHADNSYLDPSEFNRKYSQGDYHNGADWPAFTAIAQATAEMHGLKHNPELWRNILKRLKTSNHPEYFYTTEGMINQEELGYNISREHHLWNTVVYFAAKQVCSRTELLSFDEGESKERTEWAYSEASQLPGSTL